MYWTCWSWPIIPGASARKYPGSQLLVKKYLAYWLLFSTVSYNVVFQIEFSLPSDRRRCPLQVLLLLPPPLLPLLQANVVFQIEFEVMPPPGSAPPSTTSAGFGCSHSTACDLWTLGRRECRRVHHHQREHLQHRLPRVHNHWHHSPAHCALLRGLAPCLAGRPLEQVCSTTIVLQNVVFNSTVFVSSTLFGVIFFNGLKKKSSFLHYVGTSSVIT